jgi:hypothetical protein
MQTQVIDLIAALAKDLGEQAVLDRGAGGLLVAHIDVRQLRRVADHGVDQRPLEPSASR